MKAGKYIYRGYTINITSDTKESDLEFIFKAHPEFKKVVGINDNSKSKRKPKSDSDSISE